MVFTEFLSKITQLKQTPLGGLNAQFILAPEIRKQYSESLVKKNNPKKAAVLALFYPNNFQETCFLLTERASYKGTHSAQISFPGGKMDTKDVNLEETAVRETLEEVGVLKKEIKVIRELTDVFIPPSNFLATPFIAYSKEKPTFKKNYEVAEILEIKLLDLLNDTNLSTVKMKTSYMNNAEVPCFKLNNKIVWGATAMMLSEIKELFKNKN